MAEPAADRHFRDEVEMVTVSESRDEVEMSTVADVRDFHFYLKEWSSRNAEMRPTRRRSRLP